MVTDQRTTRDRGQGQGLWVLLAALLLPALLIAFWPRWLAIPGERRLAIHVHGALTLGWVLLLIVQAALAARGRPALLRWHGRLGRLSLIWTPAVVLSALWVVRGSLQRTGIDTEPLRQLALSLGGLAVFTTGWLQGLRWRRRTPLHLRYMIVAAMGLSGAAVQRLLLHHGPGFETPWMAGHGDFVLLEVVSMWLVVLEVRRRRPWRPFALALGMFVINHVVFTFADQLPPLRALAQGLRGG